MNRTRSAPFANARLPLAAMILVAWSGITLSLAACDRTQSSSKTTTTKTTETPEGTKKTTETTEKKVETNPK